MGGGRGQQGPTLWAMAQVTITRNNFYLTMSKLAGTKSVTPSSARQPVLLEPLRRWHFLLQPMLLTGTLRKIGVIPTAHIWKLPLWGQNTCLPNVRFDPNHSLIHLTILRWQMGRVSKMISDLPCPNQRLIMAEPHVGTQTFWLQTSCWYFQETQSLQSRSWWFRLTHLVIHLSKRASARRFF